jgi:Protein of unknown function (DUF3060)
MRAAICDICPMKDDDPEKRIRELERELADVTRGAQTPPSSAPRGGFGTPSYDTGFTPARRGPTLHWYTVVMLVVMGLSILTGLVAIIRAMAVSDAPRSIRGGGAPNTSIAPTAVPRGGELRATGNGETRTIACNDGKLTFTGYNSKYVVTGHCAGLVVGGYNNNVTVDSADTLESTGYGNTITDHACNNATIKLTSYGIAFNGTGHCASVAISSYDNKVTVDSVDTVIVSGYHNNVTYHQGAPKVTDSGYDNNIHQG